MIKKLKNYPKPKIAEKLILIALLLGGMGWYTWNQSNASGWMKPRTEAVKTEGVEQDTEGNPSAVERHSTRHVRGRRGIIYVDLIVMTLFIALLGCVMSALAWSLNGRRIPVMVPATYVLFLIAFIASRIWMAEGTDNLTWILILITVLFAGDSVIKGGKKLKERRKRLKSEPGEVRVENSAIS
ncbi:hypothetical protein HOA55_04695 [archaeon]|jgi:hypothetical protein|nr:hypothetical protein [archaeon]MBT6820628.1 hypothetical protein [archaeon]MBT7024962.1 hypothetical protein [archaeon]MBT7238581.1 hypothetical protein [archaeon]